MRKPGTGCFWNCTQFCLVVWLLATDGAWAGPQQLLSVRNPLAARPPDYQYSTSPVISADGRFVLFLSTANDIVPGDNSQLGTDLFLRDRSSNTTALISVNVTGIGGGNGNTGGASFSADNRFVLFESTS